MIKLKLKLNTTQQLPAQTQTQTQTQLCTKNLPNSNLLNFNLNSIAQKTM